MPSHILPQRLRHLPAGNQLADLRQNPCTSRDPYPSSAHTERIAACAAWQRFEVFSGARKSRAWAAAMASIAIALRVFSTTRFSFIDARHAHGNVIFFVARGRDRIDGRGMRQHFVLADQRGRGDLRHHESGVQSRARRKKRRQALRSARDSPCRSMRRSEIPASALKAMARKSSAKASGSP